MLSPTGMLEGITALCVLIFACMFGIFSIIQGKRKNAKLLKIAGLMMVFIGLLWLGPSTDFVWIMLFNENINNSWGLYGILSYMWVAPAILMAIYVGAELMIPDKKTTLLVLYILLSIVFEFILWTSTMESFIFVEPKVSGTELIDSQHNRGSLTFYLILVFLVSTAIFDGIGFLIKGKKSTGVIKGQFMSLSAGFLIFVLCAAMDSLMTPGIWLIFVRIGVIMSIIFLYNGLRAREF